MHPDKLSNLDKLFSGKMLVEIVKSSQAKACPQTVNGPFSKMAAKISNKLKLKTYTSTRKSTFTLVTLQSHSISGVISAEKMQVEK